MRAPVTIAGPQNPFHRQGVRHAREVIASAERLANGFGDARPSAKLSLALQMVVLAQASSSGHVAFNDIANAICSFTGWVLSRLPHDGREAALSSMFSTITECALDSEAAEHLADTSPSGAA